MLHSAFRSFLLRASTTSMLSRPGALLLLLAAAVAPWEGAENVSECVMVEGGDESELCCPPGTSKVLVFSREICVGLRFLPSLDLTATAQSQTRMSFHECCSSRLAAAEDDAAFADEDEEEEGVAVKW